MAIYGKICLAVFCLLFLTGCAASEAETDGSEKAEKAANYVEFFAQECVHDLQVELASGDWQKICEQPEEKQYYPAAVTIDGVRIVQVGFRTRGNSSLRMARRRNSERFPFRIKFDKYVKNQKFLGLDELVLTNSNDDPSYLREYFGYEAFRQIGLEAPLVTFFNLYINGELHGMYIGVEAIDNSFLKRVFMENKGNLYEAELNATLATNMSLSNFEKKKGDGEEKEDLMDLICILDEMEEGEKDRIEEILDVDSVLKYFAGNAVLHNWDDYAGKFAHNYYLYMYDGLFRMLPWDMNESFLQTQAFYRPSDGARQDIATPITGEATLDGRPLVKKLLAVPEYYAQYLEYCESLAQWMETLSDSLPLLRDRIGESVEKQPRGFFTYGDFEKEFDSSNRYGLAGFIVERAEYLSERVAELKDD